MPKLYFMPLEFTFTTIDHLDSKKTVRRRKIIPNTPYYFYPLLNYSDINRAITL